MVVACIALAVALGGTSYAAIRLPVNSVCSTQLKRGAVTAVKVRGNSLTGMQINEASLAKVPFVDRATNAATADTATQAPVTRLDYRSAVAALPAGIVTLGESGLSIWPERRRWRCESAGPVQRKHRGHVPPRQDRVGSARILDRRPKHDGLGRLRPSRLRPRPKQSSGACPQWPQAGSAPTPARIAPRTMMLLRWRQVGALPRAHTRPSNTLRFGKPAHSWNEARSRELRPERRPEHPQGPTPAKRDGLAGPPVHYSPQDRDRSRFKLTPMRQGEPTARGLACSRVPGLSSFGAISPVPAYFTPADGLPGLALGDLRYAELGARCCRFHNLAVNFERHRHQPAPFRLLLHDRDDDRLVLNIEALGATAVLRAVTDCS